MNSPALDAAGIRIFQGDVFASLAELPDDTYNAVVTSPPFWGLRSYCAADDPLKQFELGSEPTPELYLANMVRVFRDVRRVLHPTGVCFIEIGDTMASGEIGRHDNGMDIPKYEGTERQQRSIRTGLKPGEPVNIPFRLAEALRADGWYWRSTIVWHHVSCMPESVQAWRWERCKVKVKAQGSASNTKSDEPKRNTSAPDPSNGIIRDAAVWRDCEGCPKCQATGGYVLRKGKWRPTKAESYILMMTKSETYFCDAGQVKEAALDTCRGRTAGAKAKAADETETRSNDRMIGQELPTTRNPRSVQPFPPEPNTLTACKNCLYVTTGPELRKLPKKGKKPLCPNCGGTEWAGHYAAFPKAIPAFAIRAACSPKGRCPTCGTPWSPVVDVKEWGSWTPEGKPEGVACASGGSAGTGKDFYENYVPPRTLGHRPSCNCQVPGSHIHNPDRPQDNFYPPEPCKVLDPFSGSATSLVAAYEAGCHADGLELNPLYVAMSAFRLNQSMVPRGQAQAQDAPGPLFPAEAT